MGFKILETNDLNRSLKIKWFIWHQSKPTDIFSQVEGTNLIGVCAKPVLCPPRRSDVFGTGQYLAVRV